MKSKNLENPGLSGPLRTRICYIAFAVKSNILWITALPSANNAIEGVIGG